MKTNRTLFDMGIVALIGVAVVALTVSSAMAAFPLHLKNGTSQPVTFTIEMGHCYQGTGYYPPKKLTHGPIQPGGSVTLEMSRVQGHGCNGANGYFTIKPSEPRFNGEAQGFAFDNDGHLWERTLPDRFSGQLSSKSTRDESYTWTIVEPPPLVEPMNGGLVRLRNAASGDYLTQTWGGTKDDKRNVTVWPLPSGKDNSFRWLLQKAEDGDYWYLVNLETGLLLNQDGPEDNRNVSTWGRTPNNPREQWKFERQDNRYMIINKATGQGLDQVDQGKDPNKKNVTTWPGQTFADKGWSWRLEDGGSADLVKLTLENVKAIKTSTGQDAGTAILFQGIQLAIEVGAGAVTGGAWAGASAGFKAGKAAGSLTTAGIKAGAAAAKRAVTKKLVLQKAKEGAIKGAVAGGGNAALDAAGVIDFFDLQASFNKIYGESPDDLEIRVNHVSIWPNGGRDHRDIKSQQTHVLNTEYIFDRSKGLAIQLVEYDSGSADDSLGWISLPPEELGQPQRFEGVLVSEDSEGSLYEVTFRIEPFQAGAGNRAIVAQAQTGQQQAVQQQQVAQQPQQQPQAAALVSAKLSLQCWPEASCAGGTKRIPISKSDPAYTVEQFDMFPAIYLDVTFSDGSKAGPHDYKKNFAGNVIFDDTTGDPNDIIKVVYGDVDSKNPQLGQYAAQLTSTGKGVGTAYLKVSFHNAPGVTASVPVEVVGGAESQQVAQQPQQQPQAAALVSAKLSLQSGIQPGANGRNRIPVNRRDPTYAVDKLDISPAIYLDVTFSDGSKAGPHDYHKNNAEKVIFEVCRDEQLRECAVDGAKDPNDIIKVVYWDVDSKNPKRGKFAGQLTSTGNDAGTAYLKVSFRNAPGVTASVPVEVVSRAAPDQPAPQPAVVSSKYTHLVCFNLIPRSFYIVQNMLSDKTARLDFVEVVNQQGQTSLAGKALASSNKRFGWMINTIDGRQYGVDDKNFLWAQQDGGDIYIPVGQARAYQADGAQTCAAPAPAQVQLPTEQHVGSQPPLGWNKSIFSQQPVYQQPVYQQPVYQQPVKQPSQSVIPQPPTQQGGGDCAGLNRGVGC